MQAIVSRLIHTLEKLIHFDLITLTILGLSATILLAEHHYIISVFLYFPLVIACGIAIVFLLFLPQQIKGFYSYSLLFGISLTLTIITFWIV